MSIFKDQLTFEPFTEERKLILKVEVAVQVWFFSILYLVIVYLIHKREVTLFLEKLFAPLVEPLKVWGQTVMLPVLVVLSKLIHIPPELLHSISWFFKSVGYFMSTLVWPALTVACLATAIAYHSGMLGMGRTSASTTSVLYHEFRRWKIRLFEARISMRLTPKAWWRTVFSIIFLFAITAAFIYGYFSGDLAALCPFFFPLFEPGTNNWFLAVLHDAHLKIPDSWRAYSTDYQAVVRAHGMLARSNPLLAVLPFQGLPVMPEDFHKLRIFVSVLCSFVGAFPFTLSTLALGIDSVGDRHLTLTPTRLLEVKRSCYFFFHTNANKWTDLVKAELVDNEQCPNKTKFLNFDFANGRKLKVPLNQLTTKDQQTLFQALDELAPVCEFNGELKQLMSQSRKDSSVGYTIFWNDELSKKRRSTVFSPLDQGATLKEGRLEILRQLSGQGWSATYLARLNGEFVIVRESLLSEETEAGKRAWATLQNEAKILGLLNHRSIARVLDHFVESGRSYLLLEYVVGTDLRKKTSLCGKLPSKKVIEIAERICDILSYLHSQNPSVIHRDISPDNLVITPNGEIRLIDFAASKQFIETATGTMIGKRSYMAPEQLRGKANVKSDIYSLGATLHFLLTGTDPVALRQCRPIEHCPELDVRLNQLIEEMTNFDEELRPESIAQVKLRISNLREECSFLEKMFEGISSESLTIKLKHYEAEKS